ncbi:hypothetical protein [Embleya sp. NPDC020630]|uniref:hypothetical protein n=1 Tax=Embleya sp. NPDC020630 TaxID=3363979 RepID=UPI0037A44AF8
MNPPPVLDPPHTHHPGTPCPRPGTLHADAGALALLAVLGLCGGLVSGIAVARPVVEDRQLPQDDPATTGRTAPEPVAPCVPRPPAPELVPVYRPDGRWRP